MPAKVPCGYDAMRLRCHAAMVPCGYVALSRACPDVSLVAMSRACADVSLVAMSRAHGDVSPWRCLVCVPMSRSWRCLVCEMEPLDDSSLTRRGHQPSRYPVTGRRRPLSLVLEDESTTRYCQTLEITDNVHTYIRVPIYKCESTMCDQHIAPPFLRNASAVARIKRSCTHITHKQLRLSFEIVDTPR